MRQVDIEEVRKRIEELLAEVELGESIVIVQEGIPKAIFSKYVDETQGERYKYGKYAKKTSFDSYFDDDGDVSSLF